MNHFLRAVCAGAALCCALTACTDEKPPQQTIQPPSPGYVAAQPGPAAYGRSKHMEQDRMRRDPLANGRYRAYPDGRVYGGQGNQLSRGADDLMQDAERMGRDTADDAQDFLQRTEDTLRRMSEPGKKPG